MLQQPPALRETLLRKHRCRVFVELLEDRNLLNCGPGDVLLEDFNDDTMADFTTLVRYWPSATVVDGVGCDGGKALVDYDGDDWTILENPNATVSQGDFFSAWVYLGGEGDGRAYLGFGGKPPNVNERLVTGRTLSVVLAPNTNQFQIQQHLGYKFTGNNFAVLGTEDVTYTMDQWYLVLAYWAPGGGIAAFLFDADYNQVSFVTGQQTGQYPNTTGGLAFRGFGENSFYLWDSVTKFGSGAGPGDFRPPQPPRYTPAIPDYRANNPGTQGIPLPFQYTSVEGTERDIQLENISGLGHVACSTQQCPDGTYQGMIGLAASNTSRNMGPYTVPWGPSLVGHFSTDTPLNTPSFQMYLYRLDPGGSAIRIGESGIKAFWSSTWGYDYQHIAPAGQSGDRDTYGSGNNSERLSFSTTAALDPVYGQRYDYSEMGTRNEHGNYVLDRSRQFSSPFENLLQVPAEELNPNLHPGARYFLVANVFVVGDQNVANNSRWLEYRVNPTAQQNRYTFTPLGSQRLDICTIPGLEPLGRCGTGAPGSGGDGGSGSAPVAAPVDAGQVSASSLLADLTDAGASLVPPLPQRPEGREQPAPVDTIPVDQVFANPRQDDSESVLPRRDADPVESGEEFAWDYEPVGG